MSGGPARVSVIIPVRDRAEQVGAAIRSVVEQHHRPFELIVVDDGSQPPLTRGQLGTPEWLPTHLVRLDGVGAGAARNRGAGLATGDILAFLDSDDVWLPSKLGDDVRRRRPNALVISGYCVDGVRKLALPYQPRRAGAAFWLSPAAEPVSSSCIAISRELFHDVGGFDELLENLEDLDLVVSALEGGGSVVCLAKCSTVKGQSEDRLFTTERASRSRPILYSKHRSTLGTAPSARRYQLLLLGGDSFLSGDRRTADHRFMQAARAGAAGRAAACWLVTRLASHHAPQLVRWLAGASALRLRRWAHRRWVRRRIGAGRAA